MKSIEARIARLEFETCGGAPVDLVPTLTLTGVAAPGAGALTGYLVINRDGRRAEVRRRADESDDALRERARSAMLPSTGWREAITCWLLEMRGDRSNN